MADAFDLVIVGGGTAGIIAAKTAGGLGARVVLVERDRTGGDCLWTGCVPSKALIAAARIAHGMRSGSRFGIAPAEPTVDFRQVMAHVRASIAKIEPTDSPEALAKAGAEVVHGDAVFAGPRLVRVGSRQLRFRHALVATGTSPALPSAPGLAEIEPLTSNTVWKLTELPRRLVVIGGGPTGCELGQSFARLGSEVTIIEAGERLLPREEPLAARVLTERLASEGIRVLTGTTVTSAGGMPGAVELEIVGPVGPATLAADQLLVAAGRRPHTAGLGLERAGVRLDKDGHVRVDARLRTSNPRIYAAGDVTGPPAFTHVAGIHGSIAATNAVLAPLRRAERETMPRAVFTDPEIAHVGLTEAQARLRHGSVVRVRRLPHTYLDRAVTEADTDGFTQVVLGGKGRVLGAAIVAPRAGEMLAEVASVVARRGRLREVSSVVHAYPTWADAVWNTALAEMTATAARPATRRATRLLLRLRRATSREH